MSRWGWPAVAGEGAQDKGKEGAQDKGQGGKNKEEKRRIEGYDSNYYFSSCWWWECYCYYSMIYP